MCSCNNAIAVQTGMLSQRLAGNKAHCLPAIIKGPVGALLSFCSTFCKHLHRQSMYCQVIMAAEQDINSE